MFYINAQRDFLSTGTAGASSSYLRNSAIPEMGVQYMFGNFRNFSFGIGYDYKNIIPRIVTDSNLYTRNAVNSSAVIAFLHYYYRKYPYITPKFGIKAKAMYGQNCNEFLMLGGYAYKFLDNNNLNTNKDYQYTTLNSVSAWVDIYANIKEKWEIGMFGGYSKNLGSVHRIQNHSNPNAYFVRGRDIDYMYRASVRVKYTVQKLQFGFEPEYTAAMYSNTVNEKGVPQKKSAAFPDAKTNAVGNLRFLFNTTLYF